MRMLLKKPDTPDLLRVVLRLRLAGPGFFGELPLGKPRIASHNFPSNHQRITALGNGAIPPLGADQELPALSGASV